MKSSCSASLNRPKISSTSGKASLAVIGSVSLRCAKGRMLSIKSCWKASSTPSEEGYILRAIRIKQLSVSEKLSFSRATRSLDCGKEGRNERGNEKLEAKKKTAEKEGAKRGRKNLISLHGFGTTDEWNFIGVEGGLAHAGFHHPAVSAELYKLGDLRGKKKGKEGSNMRSFLEELEGRKQLTTRYPGSLGLPCRV